MTDSGVSVVIPVHNGERFLADALSSVLGQSAPPSQVIIVDDGSSDRSVEVAERFPGVTLLRKPHLGVSAARNAGVAASSEAFVAFLDADDYWHEHKLRRQLDVAEADGSAGVVVARQSYLFEGPIPSWFRGPRDGSSEPGYMPSNWLIRRPVWDRVGGFQEHMTHSEDTDWLARASDLGILVAMVDETLVVHRIHDRNASGQAAAVRAGVLSALRSSVRRKHEAAL